MDMVSLITLIASITAILGFVYFLFIGQKALPEWLEERKKRRYLDQEANNEASSLRMPRHNLPQPDYSRFIGRDGEFRNILSLLSSQSRHFLIVIEGFSGIGKTALSLAVANHFLALKGSNTSSESFEAIIWTSAKKSVLTAEGIKSRGSARLTLEDIFTTIAIIFGKDDVTRAKPDEQREIVRTILAQHRTLLIVDSFEAIDDVNVLDFLRDLPPPTKALVTSRQRVDVSYPVRLESMTEHDAQELIEVKCQEKQVKLDGNQKRMLYERTYGIPIAIAWSLARISFGFNVDATIERLVNRHLNDDLVSFCFEGVIDLTREKNEYKVLLALSLFATNASISALKSVSGVYENENFEGAIVQLVKLSLVVQGNEDSIMTLPLTRAFAANELESSGFAQAHKKNMIQYYLEFTKKYGGLQPDVGKLFEEIDNIKQAIDLTRQLNIGDDFVELVLNISRFLYVKGLYGLAMEYWDELISQDTLSNNPSLMRDALEFFAHGGVMYAYSRNERGDVAFEFLKNGLPTLENIATHNSLSLITQRLGILSRDLHIDNDHRTAKKYLEKSYQHGLEIIAKNHKDDEQKTRRLGDALNGLGAIAILNNDLASAQNLLQESNQFFEKLGDSATRSSVVRHLAEIARMQKQFKDAEKLCKLAIELATGVDRKDRLADAYKEMALLEFARKRRAKAENWLLDARKTYEKIGAYSDANRLKQLETTND